MLQLLPKTRSEVAEVIVRKKTTIDISQDPINALEGATATIECNHDIDKELQDSLAVKWFKDGDEQSADERITMNPKAMIIKNLLYM